MAEAPKFPAVRIEKLSIVARGIQIVTGGLTAPPVSLVNVSTPTGEWEELYAPAERDAFIRGVKAASALLGFQEPDVLTAEPIRVEIQKT